MPDKPRPDTPALGFTEMDDKYNLVDTLKGGRTAMIDAGEKYLPKDKDEKNYEARIQRTSFYNGYGKTVRDIVAQPFTKEVVIKEGSDSIFEQFRDDIDQEGTSLTQFAKSALTHMVDYGMCHLFSDFPATEGKQTKADELTGKVRPYTYLISPRNLIFWESKMIEGKRVLTQIRYRRKTVEKEGDFRQKEYDEIVQVLYDGTPAGNKIVVWRKLTEGNKSGEWAPHGEPAFYSTDRIPLTTAYANQTGFMTAAPLLEDLANMNLRHWHSSSEQNHILHVARVPFLFGKGFEDGTLDGKVTANSAVTNGNENSDLKWVETEGRSIELGEKDLAAIEQRMEGLGAEPMIRRHDSATATEVGIDTSKGESTMQAVVRSLEKGLEGSLAFWGQYKKVKEIKVDLDINRDFGFDLGNKEDKGRIIELHDKELLDKESTLGELKRRGLLPDDLDIEKVLIKVANEGPPLEKTPLKEKEPGTE